MKLDLTSTALALIVAMPGAAQAQAVDTQVFALRAGLSLSEALRQVAIAGGQNLVAPAALLEGKIAPALRGQYSTGEAVRRLLDGSGLSARIVGDALIIERQTAQSVSPPSNDIIVTGTRIRGRGPVGSRVIQIGRAEIDASGYGTTQQVIQAIPQNFGGGPNEANANFSARDNASLNGAAGSAINLRGLGTASTLVLLNGNRLALGGFSGVFTDISLIPSVIVERVEVLPDGASAIYGSDAVAGVVNIITRGVRDGAETRFRIGSADGDRTEVQASQSIGAQWTGGGALIAYDYYTSGRLAAADRSFATEDLRRFGGPDLRQRYATPGTIQAGGRFFGIPAGQDGRNLSPGLLLPGQINLADQWAKADLLPRQRRHSVYVRGEQRLADGFRVFVEGLFADRRSNKHVVPVENNLAWTVPVANPFYVDPLGTRQPISVLYSLQDDLGPQTVRGAARSLGGSIGAEWRPGPWSIEARANASRQSERTQTVNLVNIARMNAALRDPDPSTAYNLFGAGPSTARATIDRVRGSLRTDGRYALLSGTVKADGPVVTLPAGAAQLAMGAEYRRESFVSPVNLDDRRGLLPANNPVQGLPPARRIAAAFAELAIPVVDASQDIPLIRALDVSVAGRIEDYSDFGTTTNPKLGARWGLMHGFSVRGSYGTSFRAPGFNTLRQGPQARFIFAINLPDPRSPTGQTAAIVLNGNKPGIGPERAETWTLGFDLEPAILPGFRLSATWYDVQYRDRIVSPAAELFNFLAQPVRFAGITNRSPTAQDIAALYADPSFSNTRGVPQSSIAAIIDARVQNLSSVRQSGVDINLGYGFALGPGRLALDLSANIIDRIDQAITATAAPVDVAGTLGNPVRSRQRGSVVWTGQSFTLATFVNRTAAYRNTLVTPSARVSPWTTVDLSIAYMSPATDGPFAGTRIAITATNLLDRNPPYVRNSNGLYALAFDPDHADPLGRVVALQVSKSW